MVIKPSIDGVGGAGESVREALSSAPSPGAPNLERPCHVGHMDGVDAAGVGPGALDLCTVLEQLLRDL